ncbi:MAG: hypothetical protein AAFX39_05480 [Pseudomonadota bacterium]
MPQLLSQFDLKPRVQRARFDLAWAEFIAYLVDNDLAVSGGPIFSRQPDSGYDTDTERSHRLMAVICFRNQAQADAAWAAIEAETAPLSILHRRVFGLVHDPVFTFWSEG